MSETSALPPEKLAGELDVLRERIRALQEERAELSSASTDKRSALARVDTYVSRLVSEARVNIGPFVARDSAQPADLISRGRVGADGVGFESVLAFVAWCFPETIRAKLGAEVDAYYAASHGVDEETRARRLAQIEVELLDLEIAEERAIMALEAAGVRNVLRRPDADPRALVAA